ncbi:MAG: SH3 domain-containing protein, partial [Alphaproteobacteria bacterium]
PELEVIDNYMIAARAAPVREAPDIAAKQVGRLKDGERVHVAGKVKGGVWYAVELKGEALAYVATIALEDTEVYQARKDKEREREKEQAQEKAQQAAAVVAKVPAPAPAAATPAALPRAVGVGAYNGTWRGTMSCEASAYGPAFNSEVRPFMVADGRVSGDYDVPGYGTGGHEVYSGKVDADGNFTVTGHGENGKVGKYPIEFSGKITDTTLVGNGRMGLRHCKLSYRRG